MKRLTRIEQLRAANSYDEVIAIPLGGIQLLGNETSDNERVSFCSSFYCDDLLQGATVVRIKLVDDAKGFEILLNKQNGGGLYKLNQDGQLFELYRFSTDDAERISAETATF